MASVDRITGELALEIDDMKRQLRAAVSDFKQQTDKIDKEFTKINKSGNEFNGTLRKIGNIAIAAFSVGAVKSFASEVLTTGMRVEGIRNTLIAATGSAQLAEKEFQFLTKTTDRLGINTIEAAQAYAKLTASARGTSLEGQKTRDIFTGVAEAATVMRLSAADTAGVIRAFEQMISKGVVSSEELKLQLGDRLPGVMRIAAESTGKTTEEFIKMLENGEVLTEDFLPKFVALLSERNKDGLVGAMESAGSEVSRLSNSFDEMNTALFSFLEEGIKDVTIAISFIFDTFTGWIKLLDEITDYIANINRSIGQMVSGIFSGEPEASKLFKDLAIESAVLKQSMADGMSIATGYSESLQTLVPDEAILKANRLAASIDSDSLSGGKPSIAKSLSNAGNEADKFRQTLQKMVDDSERELRDFGADELTLEMNRLNDFVQDNADQFNAMGEAGKNAIQEISDNLEKLDFKRKAEEMQDAYTKAFQVMKSESDSLFSGIASDFSSIISGAGTSAISRGLNSSGAGGAMGGIGGDLASSALNFGISKVVNAAIVPVGKGLASAGIGSVVGAAGPTLPTMGIAGGLAASAITGGLGLLAGSLLSGAFGGGTPHPASQFLLASDTGGEFDVSRSASKHMSTEFADALSSQIQMMTSGLQSMYGTDLQAGTRIFGGFNTKDHGGKGFLELPDGSTITFDHESAAETQKALEELGGVLLQMGGSDVPYVQRAIDGFAESGKKAGDLYRELTVMEESRAEDLQIITGIYEDQANAAASLAEGLTGIVGVFQSAAAQSIQLAMELRNQLKELQISELSPYSPLEKLGLTQQLFSDDPSQYANELLTQSKSFYGGGTGEYFTAYKDVESTIINRANQYEKSASAQSQAAGDYARQVAAAQRESAGAISNLAQQQAQTNAALQSMQAQSSNNSYARAY